MENTCSESSTILLPCRFLKLAKFVISTNGKDQTQKASICKRLPDNLITAETSLYVLTLIVIFLFCLHGGNVTSTGQRPSLKLSLKNLKHMLPITPKLKS